MSKTDVINALRKGLTGGLGFGMAVGIIHLAIGVILILRLGMPPMTWFVAKSILMEVPCAVLAGLLLFPMYLHGKGRWLHPVAMTLTWIGL